MSQARILYAVLNWGLGHAARSVPVIKVLLKRDCEVLIASDGGALHLLREAFPAQPFFELPGYRIRYPARSLVVNGVLNARNIAAAIKAEHIQTLRIVRDEGVMAVVSDNRYGCHVDGTPSVLLTHQISMHTRNPLLNWLADRTLARWLSPFDEIWVPDTENRLLSGQLSASDDKRVQCIGLLSTIIPLRRTAQCDVAVILSGPEPQRSQFERILVGQLQLLARDRKIAVVRGLGVPEDKLLLPFAEVTDFMSRPELGNLVNSAEIVVCRSGYSSLMDLMIAGKRALLVPTPGQPEQLYLARKAAQLPQFVTQTQKNLNLTEGIKVLSEAPIPMPVDAQHRMLNDQIDRLLSRL